MDGMRVDRVSAGYDKLPIIQDLSIRAEAGSVTAIIGPNGSGKSTLLKAIAGILRIMSGSVEVCGTNTTGWPAHRIARQGLGYVPQTNNVFPSLSVIENLEMGAYTRENGVQGRIREILEIFPDLAKASAQKAGTLSGGQRNMMGIARALMVSPTVLLLDEPTAGLSPTYTEKVWEQARRIAGSGTAVVVVDQNVDMALSNSDVAYVVLAGHNYIDGPADEIQKEDLPSIFLGGDSKASTKTSETQHERA